ncbi:MAG: hypothetical protein JOZ29_06245 [Deltaproteobacteria bacterium]|nr:hypothetical protein [Deltaproteobacteria bacterium]
MRIPGFNAEESFREKGVAHRGRVRSKLDRGSRIIPALPIGGYGQIACVEEMCKLSPKNCASAWRMCGGASGVGPGTGPDPWCIVGCGGDPDCIDAFC